VEREVLGAAVVEHPRDGAGDVVLGPQRLGCLVEESRAGSRVEARLVAVTRERGVRPFAVEILRAEDERAVDGGALSAVGGDRVAVLEAAILGVARWQVDAAAVVERDGQPVVAHPGQRAGLPVEDPDAAVVTRRDDAVAGGEAAFVRRQLVGAEPPGCAQPLARHGDRAGAAPDNGHPQ